MGVLISARSNIPSQVFDVQRHCTDAALSRHSPFVACEPVWHSCRLPSCIPKARHGAYFEREKEYDFLIIWWKLP